MKQVEEKVIMYDSPEAGRLVTVTVWEVDNPNGIIYTPDEHIARWANCTHKVCDCGKPMYKHYTKCESCRHKASVERYNALPFKEWDLIEPVVTWDGDTYFFNEEDLVEFMEDNEMIAIDLLFCKENKYSQVNEDYWSDVLPEDGEISNEMKDALNKLNNVICEQHAASYSPGKIRTTYKIN